MRTARSKTFIRSVPTDESAPVNVGVVGYGYWGPNLVRNITESRDLTLGALCERDPVRGEAFARKVPGVPVVESLDELLLDPRIEAVVVATPPSTHYGLVKQALEADKHVMVEKPMARTAAQAQELVDIAEQRGLTLMPGHTFLYSPSVNKVRDLIREDAVGEVYFVTSSRMNLGNWQPDGVICDLAPHDLSILLHWLDRPVVQASVSARDIFRKGVTETAFISLTFEGGTAANLQISWLAPRKVRQMMIVGSRRMIAYDDTSSDESVRLYDRGMEFTTPESFGEYQLTYRSGDMIIPRVEAAEPLGLELADFAQAIRTGSRPVSHAGLGLEVVMAMEAIELSLLRGGEPVTLEPVNPEPVSLESVSLDVGQEAAVA